MNQVIEHISNLYKTGKVSATQYTAIIVALAEIDTDELRTEYGNNLCHVISMLKIEAVHHLEGENN